MPIKERTNPYSKTREANPAIMEDAAQQPADEPVALKRGECWPEYVMQEWDYWREQIANGNTGSAPRDWFEELAELKLVNARPQPAAQWVGLTDKERNQLWRDVVKWGDPSHDDVDLMKAIEQALKEKNI